MKHNKIKILSLFLILIALCLFSINVGYTQYSFSDTIRILCGGGTPGENLVIFDFRLTRILLSVFVGMGFALAGLSLQALTKNPLADSSLLGINAGASLMLVIYLTIAGTMTLGSILALPVFSLFGAITSGLILYLLSYKKGRGLDSKRLILNGIAIQLGMNAVLTIMTLTLDSNQYDFLVRFQTGNFWNVTWDVVIMLVPWIIAGSLFMASRIKSLNIMELGDEVAIDLGVNVKKEKKMLMGVALVVAAACVSAGGNMSFVGLLAPHISRKIVGTKYEHLIPTTLLVGGILVVVADMIARVIIQPTMLPTGIVTSIIGAPYFIFMYIRQGRGGVSK